MCGLVAAYAYRDTAPDVGADELVACRDAMQARGPDGAGLWLHERRRLGLAHRRLSIIDLSDAAAQPLASGDGRYRIVFNGEIYNYRALRHELERAGATFATVSDTEVIVAAYARWGVDCLAKLRGMFAFVLWDDVGQKLIAARDPYGIKPLYVADDGTTVRLASQVKALLAGGGVSRDVDTSAVAGFLSFGYVPEPFTIFRAIRALPAGSYVTAERGRVSPPVVYADMAQTIATGDDTPGAPSIAETVRDSVAAHLVADVPVGVFLSAGVDSTLLAWQMAALQPANKPLAITLAFDEFLESPLDETPLATATARRLGLRQHVARLTRDRFVGELNAALKAMDQPSIDGLNTYFVAQAARQAGLKTVVSGVGGDELFAGYPSFRNIPRWLTAARRLRPLRPLAPAWSALVHGARWLLPEAPIPVKLAGVLDVPATLAGMYLLRRSIFLPRELSTAMADVGIAAPHAFDALAHVETIAVDRPPNYRSIAALESCLYMRNQLLRDADWAGMAHSLEIRTPLVDAWLTRAIMPHLGAADRVDKTLLLTEANHAALTPAVNRPKTGFSTPIERWLVEAGLIAEPKYPGAAARDWALYVLRRYLEDA